MILILYLNSFQALECVLKIYKVKKKNIQIESPSVNKIEPGLRSDNQWLQYKSDMTENELQEYWQKSYSVKPEIGFYTWTKPKVKLHVPDDTQLRYPDFVPVAFLNFYNDKTKRDKFIELNIIEHKKGEDSFSMDKGLLYCSLVEAFGCEMAQILAPYVEKFSKSTEESEQR